MNDATSLDHLHDIVIPPDVPWWPPAPGWHVVSAIAACLIVVLLFRAWRRWRANAYRRAALRALHSAGSAAEISEVLRRTALAIAPRSVVAAHSGADWPNWLSGKVTTPMPEHVREQLAVAAYRGADESADVSELRDYAAQWIGGHRSDEASEG